MLVIWSLVFALLGFAAIGTALLLWVRAQMHRAAVTNTRQQPAPSVEQRVTSRFASPSRETALSHVKRALQIREPGKVEEWFRVGSASPETVVGFLRNRESVDGPITEYIWLSSMDANDLLLDGVAIKSKFEGKPRTRLAFLTPDDKGKWKIDFDAFARTVQPAWRDLMAMTAGEGLVRILFSKDTYFNGPFMDETRWTCYRMASPDIPDDFSGYCRKDSPQAAAMKRMLVQSNVPNGINALNRATLEIRRVAGAEPRQFEITRVLAEDWVLSDTPFDATR